MKKIMMFFFTICLSLSVAGCSTTPTEKPNNSEENKHYDVIVVGGGSAGLTAAVTAAQDGASVLLIEKQAFLGGSSIMSAGAATRAAKEGDPEGSYTADQLYQHWYDTANGDVDAKLLRLVADKSIESTEWIKSLGIPMELCLGTYYGKALILECPEPLETGELGSSGSVLIKGLSDAAEASGVEIILDTPVVELTVDEKNAVTGVVAQSEDGNVAYEAGAVILATGGFSANQELIEETCPDLLTSGLPIIGGAGNTGDAIAMTKNLGAKTIYPDEVGNGCYSTAAKGFGMYRNGLIINESGERFMNESDFYGKVYMTLRQQIREGHSAFWMLLDQNNYAAEAEAGVEAGTVLKADTLDELAALINVDAEMLKATASRYTELAGKEDEDFGKAAELMKGLSEGPYYAISTYGMALGTFGGLCINTDANIIKDDGSIISNLYGAGECVNATFFSNEYPYSGSCIQYSFTTGRIAGANAAALTK